MLQTNVQTPPDSTEPSQQMSKPLYQQIVALLDMHKAQDIVVIDLNNKSDMADYLVVATGNGRKHVGALADHLQEKLKSQKIPLLSLEGTHDCEWVLVDFGDVVVHLFTEQSRGIYNLEQMWGMTTPDSHKRS